MLLIGEVATLATDYAVAALALALAWRLRTVAATRAMAPPFAWLALAALAGGTFHGVRATLGEGGKVCCGERPAGDAGVQLFAARELRGAASRRSAGMALQLARRGQARALPRAFAARSRLSVVARGLRRQHVAAARRVCASLRRARARRLAVRGGRCSRCSAHWFRDCGSRPSASFNHNDLYHVVQMASMSCFYRRQRVRSRGTRCRSVRYAA